METDLFVFMDYDLLGMRNFIALYNPMNLGLIGKEKQKCFMVCADGPRGPYGVPSTVFWVFPTFIISGVACDGGMFRQYYIESHTLGSRDLRCLKHAKLCYKDDISKVLSRFQSVNQCEKSEGQSTVLLREFKKDEDEFFLKKQLVESERLSLNREKQELSRERQVFEKEKHKLETELAKYKGIVENCKKEIESFGF